MADFGPRNLHENRPETFQSEELLFATYHNAGLRIFDIHDAFAPKEIAGFVPDAPARILDPRPGYALAPMTCDINVQPDRRDLYERLEWRAQRAAFRRLTHGLPRARATAVVPECMARPRSASPPVCMWICAS